MPDLNPALFLGLALSFLPHKALEYSARKLVGRLNLLYPNLVERLSDANGKSFKLVLADMPLNAMLYVDNGSLSCHLIENNVQSVADVTVRGSSETLLALLEGRCDGDALFFSRALQVEGDTGALLVLRNALDNEQILLRNVVCSLFGPLSGVASRIAMPLEKLGGRFARDMNWIFHSAISPLVERQATLSEGLQVLEHRFEQASRAQAKEQVRSVRNG